VGPPGVRPVGPADRHRSSDCGARQQAEQGEGHAVVSSKQRQGKAAYVQGGRVGAPGRRSVGGSRVWHHVWRAGRQQEGPGERCAASLLMKRADESDMRIPLKLLRQQLAYRYTVS